MPFQPSVPSLVIRYSYRWRAKYLRGQEEGVKECPPAVVLTTTTEDRDTCVTVLPITHLLLPCHFRLTLIKIISA